MIIVKQNIYFYPLINLLQIRGNCMKTSNQQSTSAKIYVKAWLKLLTALKNTPRQLKYIALVIDSYFFDEDSADVRPYFYGSIGFSLFVIVALSIVVR